MTAWLLSALVLVPAGTHIPFYSDRRAPVPIASFWIDEYPVTNTEYRAFVEPETKWRKSQVKALFADEHYLEAWSGDLTVPLGQELSAVIGVSWFAARAFCRLQGKRLPTTLEWEHAAAREDPSVILDWYSKPRPRVLPPVSTTARNALGVHGLHGLVWEWTSDFAEVSGDNGERFLCGGASDGAADPRDYAAFMRYAFRGSLEARFGVATLGFRCAKDLVP